MVVLRGPGHHDRARRAQAVISAIVAEGLDVVVTTDLRPRLADDVRALLDAGARSVRLEADGIVGDLAPQADDIPQGPVLVVLRAGSEATTEVRGQGSDAARIRSALERLDPAEPAN